MRILYWYNQVQMKNIKKTPEIKGKISEYIEINGNENTTS